MAVSCGAFILLSSAKISKIRSIHSLKLKEYHFVCVCIDNLLLINSQIDLFFKDLLRIGKNGTNDPKLNFISPLQINFHPVKRTFTPLQLYKHLYVYNTQISIVILKH